MTTKHTCPRCGGLGKRTIKFRSLNQSTNIWLNSTLDIKCEYCLGVGELTSDALSACLGDLALMRGEWDEHANMGCFAN